MLIAILAGSTRLTASPAVQDTTPEAVEDAAEQAEFDAFLDAVIASEAAEMAPADVEAKPRQPGLEAGVSRSRSWLRGFR